MEKEVVEIYTNEIHNEAATRFGITANSLKKLSERNNSSNFIYEYVHGGEEKILRVTHSSHRTTTEIEGELDWVIYLTDKGLSTRYPLPSPRGNLVEKIDIGDSYFSVVGFRKAKGKLLDDVSLKPELVQEWGRVMGRMHAVTKDYKPSREKLSRYHWFDDPDIKAEKFLLPEDSIVKRCKEMVNYLHTLPKTRDSYGLVHADIHQWNTLVDNGRISILDFEESQYRWFVSDIAITLYFIRFHKEHEPERITWLKDFFTDFMKGYEEENHLETFWLAEIPTFLKMELMNLYICINREWNMNNLNSKRREIVARYRNKLENDIPVLDLDFRTILEEEWKKK